MAVSGWALNARNTSGIILITVSEDAAADGTISDETLIFSGAGSRLGVIDGATGRVENCQLRILEAASNGSPDESGAGNADASSVLGITDANGPETLIIDGCHIVCQTDGRKNLVANQWLRSRIVEEGDTGRNVFYSLANGVLQDVVIEGVRQWEIAGTPAIASGVTVRNCIAGLQIYNAGRIDMIGFDVEQIGAGVPDGYTLAENTSVGQTTVDFHSNSTAGLAQYARFTLAGHDTQYTITEAVAPAASDDIVLTATITPALTAATGIGAVVSGAGRAHLRLLPGNQGNNHLWNWNPGPNFSDGQLYMIDANNRYYRGYTWLRTFQDEDGPVEGVKVIYRDDRTTAGTFVEVGRWDTDADGLIAGGTNSQRSETLVPLGLEATAATGNSVTILSPDIGRTINQGGTFLIAGDDTVYTASLTLPVTPNGEVGLLVTPPINTSFPDTGVHRDIIPAFDTKGLLWILTRQAEQDAGGALPLNLVYPGFGAPISNKPILPYDMRDIRTRIEVKSYGHLPVVGHGIADDVDVSVPLGTLDDAGEPLETSAFDLIVDPSITETDIDVVKAYTRIDNADQLYDALKVWWVEEASEDFAITKNGDTIDFGDLNVEIARGSAPQNITRTANKLIINRGTAIILTANIITTGVITVVGILSLNGFRRDANGASALVTITEHGRLGNLFRFAPNSNLGSSTVTRVPASNEGINRFIYVPSAAGSVPEIYTVDTTGGGEFSLVLNAADEFHLLPDGTQMYDATASTANIAPTTNITDLSDVRAYIRIGDGIVSAASVYKSFIDNARTNPGMQAFLVYGDGKYPTINLSATAGNDVYLPERVQLRRAAAGDNNATVRANVYHPSGTIIDGVNGSVNLTGGVDLQTLKTAIALAILTDTDIDPDTIGHQSLAMSLIQATVNAQQTADNITSADHGLAAIKTAIDAVPTSGGGGGGSGASVADIVAGILAGDLSSETTAGTLSATVKAISDRVNDIPTDAQDFPTVAEIQDGLLTQDHFDTAKAELQTLIEAIPTDAPDFPTVDEIVAGITIPAVADIQDGLLMQDHFDTAKAELQTLIEAIPTDAPDFPTVDEIVAGITIPAVADIQDGLLTQDHFDTETAGFATAANIPSVGDIATGVLGAAIFSNVNVQKCFEILLATLSGSTILDGQGRVTYLGLDPATTAILRHSFGTATGERDQAEIL